MDKILIEDLEIYAFHGVLPEETILGQKFFISMELYLDTRQAGKKDDLSLSVSYADICKATEKFLQENTFQLIETCAEQTAELLLTSFPLIQKIKIKIKKPWAPIGSHINYVAIEIERQWHTAYISLGSNLGNKEENLKQAIDALSSKQTKVTKVSSFYQTKPVGYLEQDDFLNCALEIKTVLSPQELMECALEIEQKLKRERLIHWGPRTIDIDILLFDTFVTTDDFILLPHPRMTERLFVLTPLAEIAPNILHPLTQKRILSLKEELEQENPDL